jgi:hypothetical protein
MDSETPTDRLIMRVMLAEGTWQLTWVLNHTDVEEGGLMFFTFQKFYL